MPDNPYVAQIAETNGALILDGVFSVTQLLAGKQGTRLPQAPVVPDKDVFLAQTAETQFILIWHMHIFLSCFPGVQVVYFSSVLDSEQTHLEILKGYTVKLKFLWFLSLPPQNYDRTNSNSFVYEIKSCELYFIFILWLEHPV